jgi:hypothetical protein
VDSIDQDMKRGGDTSELSLTERLDVVIRLNDTQQLEEYLRIGWRASKVQQAGQ